MPSFKTTTKQSNSVWKSPDGQREIFEVVLDYEGQPVKAKTYSKDISTVGWEGTVDTYEKSGKNGSETFVKQPPKEDGQYGGQASTAGRTGSNYVPKDEKAIQAMWAIGQSVQAHNGSDGLDVTELASVEALAVELNAMVIRVKGEERNETTTTTADVVIDDIPAGPIDMSDIDALFPDNEKVSAEKSWQPKS